jgi:nucleoside-diphosphate-sugar epimerase
MTKVGIVGANGQVGAELCLLLQKSSELELVAVCRNRSGSAFLRWQGIACRHGRVADPDDALRLLGDCDVVVNSALATGTPSEIRRTEEQIIHHVFRSSKPTATIIHFSTQSVYGDPRPDRRFRRRNSYARVKLASEKHVRVEQKSSKKSAYILRLGHVCGTMQEISHSIRESIREGTVVLPTNDCSSNTVYTASIAGAILQIIRGAAQPGTYDLMNAPLWTWREVYEYEAQRCEMALEPLVAPPVRKPPQRVAGIASLARMGASLVGSRPLAEFAAKAFAHAPNALNNRAVAWWNANRARREIAALSRGQRPPEHLSWRTNGSHYFPADQPTRSLLDTWQAPPLIQTTAQSWPEDLPDAVTGDHFL